MSRQPRGRRPGRSDTKQRIALAARRQFAERGFTTTTLRTIADEAGVDTRLVSHYYGSKQQLFLAVLSLPLTAEEVGAHVATLPVERVAEGLAAQFVDLVENESTGETLAGVLQAATGEGAAAHALRDLLHHQVWAPLLAQLRVDHPQARADLLGSVAAGYLFSRRIMGVPSMASGSRAVAIASLTPLFQHALTGSWADDLSEEDSFHAGLGGMPQTETLPAPCPVTSSQLKP